MKNQDLSYAVLFDSSKRKAILQMTKCMYPGCTDNAISSHILQKKGTLSLLATDNHLWEFIIHPFSKPPFQFHRTGINNVFTFKCFCKKHDNDLFKKIEKDNIDFNDYESQLLLVVRDLYFEIFKKNVIIEQYKIMLPQIQDAYIRQKIQKHITQSTLAIRDLDFYAKRLWDDLKYGSKSFVFTTRYLPFTEICISSLFTYENSSEISAFKQKTGFDLSRTSEIFIILMPWENRSVLIMGYLLEDEKKVKGYFNAFFKENEAKLQRMITNLIMFKCENWIASDEFYNLKIEPNLTAFQTAVDISKNNMTERKNFPVNLFGSNFKKEFNTLVKELSRY